MGSRDGVELKGVDLYRDIDSDLDGLELNKWADF
jgi:hypothetical protein